MTYVITQPCIGEKDASCVDVCPVDCIHPSNGETFVLLEKDGTTQRLRPTYESAKHLYINPDECIDCGACEPACPVTAIFEESAVPEKWNAFIQFNRDFYNPAIRWEDLLKREEDMLAGAPSKIVGQPANTGNASQQNGQIAHTPSNNVIPPSNRSN